MHSPPPSTLTTNTQEALCDWEITARSSEGVPCATMSKGPGRPYLIIGDAVAMKRTLGQLRAMPGFLEDPEAAARRAYDTFIDLYPDIHGSPPWDQLNPNLRRRWLAIASAARS